MAISITIQEYKGALVRLFPKGYAWIGKNLRLLQEGIANEFARIHVRAIDLIEESDPRTTVEMLPEWENFAGLPDDTSDLAPSIAERQRHLSQKILSRGGQDQHHYEEMAENLNIDNVDVSNVRLALYGRARCGERLNAYHWLHWFEVNGPASIYKRSQYGEARCGDRIVEIGNKVLERTIRKYKPAHTRVNFYYA